MLKYKDFSLIKPDKFQSETINEIIEKYDGSIFHEVDLNKIVEKQFNTELFYLVNSPQNIELLSPIHIEKSKFGARRYNFMPLGDIPYAGFIGKAKDLIDINKFSIGSFESIKYSGFPYVNDEIHKMNDSISIGETNMVDLSLGDDEIFNRMSSSKRRNIRKAIKSGIEIKQFFTIEGLEQFWPILKQLHDALGFHHFTLDYYYNFLKVYGAQKKAFILIAYKDQNPISGLFIMGNKNYMHFYKGASLFNVKKEGQGELLHWEAIKYSKSLGAKYYDLCNLNKEMLPEIYRFKTGISKNIIKYCKYTENRFGFKILNNI